MSLVGLSTLLGSNIMKILWNQLYPASFFGQSSYRFNNSRISLVIDPALPVKRDEGFAWYYSFCCFNCHQATTYEWLPCLGAINKLAEAFAEAHKHATV
jgi:hypothetical protein